MATLARLWQRRCGFWVDVAPAIVYLGVLFWAGLTPLQQLPGPDFELADKVWHLLAFGGLAGLAARALAHWGRSSGRAAIEAALFSAALGALLEGLQSLTPYRAAEWADLVADALGALLAYGALRALAHAAGPARGAP